MELVVLNFDRSTERLAQFRRDNPSHADIRRFSAVDGRTLDRAEMQACGVLSPELLYGDGALGSALSHLGQWQHAAQTGRPITVLEDDAVLCGNFREEAARLLASLPAGWDFVLWGYNFDTFLTYHILPGLSSCTATFDQERLRRTIGTFHTVAVTATLYRLVCALGIPGYTISPQGAMRLLRACLPLRPAQSFYPGLNQWFGHRSIDFMLNTLHETHATYVAVPPLVVSANEASTSTVAGSL